MKLELQQVEKRLGDFKLHPLNLTIEPGEFFCLLGPSGCGKTTALRLIGGFEVADRGKILLGDKDITLDPPYKRNIHTVFQKYALFPHLNVFDNVAFSLKIKGNSPSEIESKVNRILDLVEITPLKHRRISEISGGQGQRVALARALVDQPAVVLLDEPLSALDPALRGRMREELRAICRKVGITFLMVTHDQEEALQVSDRLAVFLNGHCLQQGTPKSIYEDPVNRFVAGFIGPINEIPGELQENTSATAEAPSWLLQSSAGTFTVKKNGQTLPKQVCMILRPEKIRILRSKSNTPNLMEAMVQDLTYLGSRTEYLVQTSGGLNFRVFEPELEKLKKRSLNPKDKVYLSWRGEDAIVLPREV